MSDVRATIGVPVTANFAGVSTPSICAPVVVDSATGYLYTLKTGDIVKPSGSANLDTWSSVTPGTGVTTALAVNVGSAGAFVTFNGALGTPSSGTLTNCSGLPAAGVTGTALVAAAIGTTVQAYDADLTTWSGITPGANVGTALAVAVGTDGAFVVKGGALGAPSSGTLTNATGLPYSGLANGTAGNLITWSAAGAAAVVATGTAAQVLTSNGAGAAPTFQAVDGQGTWTVTANAFTEGGGGSLTTSGTYTKIGRHVHMTATLSCSGGHTISAVAGTSYLSGSPFSAAASSGGTWINISTGAIGGTCFQAGAILIVSTAWTGAANQGFTLNVCFDV